TIIGSEVNLAQRLEQAADPGGILISSETHALVEREIEAVEQQPLHVKGFQEAVRAYAVRGETQAPGTRKVFQWERLGMRVLVDLDRLPDAERAAAAVELRQMTDRVH